MDPEVFSFTASAETKQRLEEHLESCAECVGTSRCEAYFRILLEQANKERKR